MTDRLLEIADELYGLPQGDFTARRDALAKQLKAEDAELAAGVKGLRKAGVAAWVVDLLVRRETEQVAQLLSVGEALRGAQEAMDADQLRALTRQRRQLTAAMTTVARRHAKAAGVAVTAAVAEQVEQTLTAALLDADAGRAVRSGLLVAPLTPTTVDRVGEAVAVPAALGFAPTAAVAEPAETGLRVVPDPDADAKALAAARERLAAASSVHADAETAVEHAAAEVAELEARSLQLQAEIDELRRRIGDRESDAEAVEDELSDAEDARTEAAEALAGAAADRHAAAAEVERLSRRAGS